MCQLYLDLDRKLEKAWFVVFYLSVIKSGFMVGC